MKARSYSVTALAGVPIVQPGDSLPRIVLDAVAATGMDLQDGDVVVLAQKIVSKAEGRMVALTDVTPSPAAAALAGRADKDPRLVELILSQADEVVRERPGVIIVRNGGGLVLANAGIDQSNVPAGMVLLLPTEPDESAARLRSELLSESGKRVAVVVIDSLGRAWRRGTIGTAIGIAGIPAVLDLRGQSDLCGRELESTELGLADEIAAAASLAMGQSAEGTPVVIIRGLSYPPDGSIARDIVRPAAMDLFR